MTTRKAHILFLNTGTGSNLGDRAMLLNVVRLTRSHLPDAVLSVSTDAPVWLAEEFGLRQQPCLIHVWGRWEIVSNALRLPAILRKTLAPVYHGAATIGCACLSFLPCAIRRRIPGMEGRFINSIADADCVYFSGGGYLTDKGMIDARGLLWTAIVANWHGATIVMTGQGLGPFSSSLTKRLMSRVVRSAKVVVTREAQVAARYFHEWNIEDRMWSAGVDDACSLPFELARREDGGPVLAVHHRVSPFHPDEGAISQALLAVVQEHLSRGFNIHLFVFQESEALEMATYRRWVAQLPDGRVRIIRSPDPRALRADLAACQRAVGTAYHFILFAMLAGIPAVAIFQDAYYRTKFEGLAKMFGRPQSLLEFADLSARAILERLDQIGALGDAAYSRSDAQGYSDACDQQISSALRRLCSVHDAER